MGNRTEYLNIIQAIVEAEDKSERSIAEIGARHLRC